MNRLAKEDVIVRLYSAMKEMSRELESVVWMKFRASVKIHEL